MNGSQKESMKLIKLEIKIVQKGVNKLWKIMSTKIINPQSDIIASRLRNHREKIEDKLLRDGEKTKQKNIKKQEEFFKASHFSCRSNAPTTKKLDYKKALYPHRNLIEQEKLDLESISKIESRQQVINKLFSYYRSKSPWSYLI